ncbi:hypothetical protein Dimus_019307 [Dionaea muscipula]
MVSDAVEASLPPPPPRPPGGAVGSSQRVRTSNGRTSGPTRRSTKGQWTPEEDEILCKAVQHFKGKNWKKIAERFKDRSDVQCLHRWQKVLNPELIKGPWSKEEDETIIQLVEKFGPKKWSTIAQHLPGRIGKQCRERWHNHLNPCISKEVWTQDEELILIHAHQIYGNKWAELSKFLPGRTDNAIKNHWNSSVKKKLDSYIASGLLAQFKGCLSVPSSSSSFRLLQQTSGDEEEGLHKHKHGEEENSESSQSSVMAGGGGSQTANAAAVSNSEEEHLLKEDDDNAREPATVDCPTVSCCEEYCPPYLVVDTNYSLPETDPGMPPPCDYTTDIAGTTTTDEGCHHHHLCADDIEILSSLEFGPFSCLAEDECGVCASVDNDRSPSFDANDIVDFARYQEASCSLSSSLSSCFHNCSSADNTTALQCQSLPCEFSSGSGNGSRIISSRSEPNDSSSLVEPQWHWQDLAAAIASEPEALVYSDWSRPDYHIDLTEDPDGGVMIKDSSSSRLVSVNTFSSGPSNDCQQKQNHHHHPCASESTAIICPCPCPCPEEHEAAGALFYEPPRFTSSLDVPFFNCDLAQSAMDREEEEEYSPLGIRKLMMMSSQLELTPFKLWDSSPSPDVVLKNAAARTFSCTPSILKKRHRGLLSPLSPLSEGRFDRKFEADVSSPQLQGTEASSSMEGKEDKENVCCSEFQGRTDDGSLIWRQVLVERNVDHVLSSSSSSSTGKATKEEATLEPSDRAASEGKQTSEAATKQGGGGETSDPDNEVGIENLNIFNEMPFKQSIESPASGWKSPPWFFNPLVPGATFDTEITIEDLGLFMSPVPVEKSYDAIGLMKQINEQSADAYADAREVLGSDTPESILKQQQRSLKIQYIQRENNDIIQYGGQQHGLHPSSNAMTEPRTLDFSECGTPGKLEREKSAHLLSPSTTRSLLTSYR